MKIHMLVSTAAAGQCEATPGMMKIKTTAPRRRVFRNETPESRRAKLERKREYRANKAQTKRDNAMYRRRNKLRIKQREKYLERAPKKPPVQRQAASDQGTGDIIRKSPKKGK